MGYSTFYSIRRLAGVLFLSALVLGITLGREHRLTTMAISIGLILGGIPAFAYGLVSMRKYKEVFDYEPTVFWGKQSNGKNARDILTTFNVVGIWCTLTGIALLFVV
jgi:hypothetical protein